VTSYPILKLISLSNKKWVRLLGTILILGCGGVALSGEKGGAQYSETNRDIQVKVGEVFTIRLTANETTGYTWRENENFDRSYLKLTGSSYHPDQPQRAGSGGEQRYTFKALQTGATRIKLTYKRSWEVTPSDQTVTFFVRISNP
jgi:predicted secreted protein